MYRTFDEFKIDWYEHHIFANYFKDSHRLMLDERFDDLTIIICQKLDWMDYCKEQGIQVDRPFRDTLFDELLQEFTKEVIEGGMIRYGDILDFLAFVSSEDLNHYDYIFLDKVKDILNKETSFSIKYNLFKSWIQNREHILETINLGLPIDEVVSITAFYKKHRDEFIKIRDTDFYAMKDMANYYSWVYVNCKAMYYQKSISNIIKIHDFMENFMRDVLASARNNGFDDYVEQIKHIIDDLKAEIDDVPDVFISYNWNNMEEADKIENAIKNIARVHRDKNDVKPGDDLKRFMKSIRRQDFAILIVSDVYLRSKNCMYEVVQLLKDYEDNEDTFWDKVKMYVMTKDVYKDDGRIDITNYWTNLSTDIERKISIIPTCATDELIKEARIFRYISMEIGKLLKHINDEISDCELDEFIAHTKERLEKWAQYKNVRYYL